MNIVIRVDASIYIGSGHVMRCLVLATALKEQGHNVCFFSRPQQGDLIDFIRSKEFIVKELVTPTHWLIPKHNADYTAWLQVNWQEDAKSLITQIECVDLVIVDHYGLDANWELFIKTTLECKIFAIDDLLRQHQAEMILDQTLLRVPSEYNELNPNAIAITGCDFSLLNPHFVDYRKKALHSCTPPRQPHVFVSMGGIDQPNATLKTLQILSTLITNKPYITVLLSPKAPHYQVVKAFCAHNTKWISHIDFTNNMAELMLKNHFSIGAPGTTSWERACLGIPSIIVPLAENQEVISSQLVNIGAAIKVGISEISDNLLTAYENMIKNWESMRLVNLAIVDGLGIFRVTQCINELENKTINAIILRPAKKSDIKQVYDWQILPETRRYALIKDIPTWKEHQDWMISKLTLKSNFFYIIESFVTRESIGVVRLDKKNDELYIISIFICPHYFGQGYAKKALRYIDLIHPNITIRATVLKENTASQRLFMGENYTKIAFDTFIRSPLH